MRVAERWDAFWFAEASLVRLALIRIVVYALALSDVIAYSFTAFADAGAVTAGTQAKVWKPIYLFDVLGLEPIGIDTARAVFLAALVAHGASIAGLFTRLATPLAALLSIYWTGLVYSFGKVHHDKVALAFALCALAVSPCGARFSIDALIRRARSDRASPLTSPFAGLAIRVTQVTVALGYCAAGVTKLWVAGLEWMNGYTLMAMLMHYDNAGSEFVSRRVGLCRALSVFTVFVQASFPVVFVWPRARWFYLPAAVGFHLTTWWSMDTGPYITLWLLLVAFLPLERVPRWVASAWRDGAIGTASWRTVVCIAPTALVMRILWYQFPAWTLLVAVPALAWIVRELARQPNPALADPRGPTTSV